jgi:hypothetical protein
VQPPQPGAERAAQSDRSQSNQTARQLEICAVDSDGSGLARLTAAWPDTGGVVAGQDLIAFASEEGSEIFVMDADGSSQTRITDGAVPAPSQPGRRTDRDRVRSLRDSHNGIYGRGRPIRPG